MKEPTKIPKRDEQISGSICAFLTSSENWFGKFFHKFLLAHNLFILQLIVTKFGRGACGWEKLSYENLVATKNLSP